MKLNEYNNDGANYQAQAVLCYLSAHDGIDSLWSTEFKNYTYSPEVARWHNCREQGYVVTLNIKGKQLCIAFFEHRNSDNICAVKWIQGSTINPPTIDTAEFGNIYKDKWDVSKSVGYQEAGKMAEWIWSELEAFAESIVGADTTATKA